MRRREFRELIERIDLHIGETREVIRESALRQERALQQWERRLQRLEIEFRDSRDERRKHTEGLYALVDEIKRGFPPRSEPA